VTGSLTYEINEPLDIPTSAFQGEVAIVFAHGTRYGGQWIIVIQFSADGDVLGEIETAASNDPDAALETATSWIGDYCAAHNMKILKSENLNGQFPPDQAPYFALARIILAHPA
jgi:hypothetical protein